MLLLDTTSINVASKGIVTFDVMTLKGQSQGDSDFKALYLVKEQS